VGLAFRGGGNVKKSLHLLALVNFHSIARLPQAMLSFDSVDPVFLQILSAFLQAPSSGPPLPARAAVQVPVAYDIYMYLYVRLRSMPKCKYRDMKHSLLSGWSIFPPRSCWDSREISVP
jgi:hypothetical protein